MNLIEQNARFREEDNDDIGAVIPPPDIIAFNESRSCADLYRMYSDEQLITKSDFQRQVVWSDKEQALFVDSLVKQLPIPSLCIGYDISEQKRYVIDGLQRISTIIRFLDYKKKDWKFPNTLDIDPRLSQKNVSDIAKENRELISLVQNLSIPITVLRCDFKKSGHMEYLFQIFKRLNSGGRKLYNQEIRNCVYSGPFNNFLKSFVKQKPWLEAAKTTPQKVDDARFANEERVLRFLAFYYNRDSYNGNLAQFLNIFMQKNRNAETRINEYNDLLTRTLSIINGLSIPANIIKNKNLFEGVMIGVAVNLDKLEKEGPLIYHIYLTNLLEKDSYKTKAPEGMSHRSKVLERMEEAISAFGA